MSLHVMVRRLAYDYPWIKVITNIPPITFLMGGIELGDIVSFVRTTILFASKSSRGNRQLKEIGNDDNVYLITNIECDATGWIALKIMGMSTDGWVWLKGSHEFSGKDISMVKKL
jgi:hypothetical protein